MPKCLYVCYIYIKFICGTTLHRDVTCNLKKFVPLFTLNGRKFGTWKLNGIPIFRKRKFSCPTRPKVGSVIISRAPSGRHITTKLSTPACYHFCRIRTSNVVCAIISGAGCCPRGVLCHILCLPRPETVRVSPRFKKSVLWHPRRSASCNSDFIVPPLSKVLHICSFSVLFKVLGGLVHLCNILWSLRDTEALFLNLFSRQRLSFNKILVIKCSLRH